MGKNIFRCVLQNKKLIMITITWHLLLIIVLLLLLFCVAITRGTKGMFGSPRAIALLCWAVFSLVVIMIYGGFTWW